jgi:hypothetical protein
MYNARDRRRRRRRQEHFTLHKHALFAVCCCCKSGGFPLPCPSRFPFFINPSSASHRKQLIDEVLSLSNSQRNLSRKIPPQMFARSQKQAVIDAYRDPVVWIPS